MNSRILFPALFAIITLSGCRDESVQLTEVLNYGNCSGLSAGIRTVTLDEVAKLRGMTMFGGEFGGGSAPDATAPVDQTGMPVLIAVSRGEQPSAGYSLSLRQGQMKDDTLQINVEWKAPSADAMTAQVITHPCLVVGLPDPAPAHVEVVTTAGEVIGSLSLPH